MFQKLSFLLSLTLILTACDSDSDTPVNTGGPDPVDPSTGVLVDSPVINIDYRTATGSRTGTTNGSGEFQYIPGDTLIFEIGDLEFPPATAGQIVTPMDMADTRNIELDRVLNIVRLLMTLDVDGNPDNGITISDTAKSVATQVDFMQSGDNFAQSDAVTNLIFNAGQDTVPAGLVGREEALAHFEAQLIDNFLTYGSSIAELNENTIIAFLNRNDMDATRTESGMYYIIEEPGSGDAPSSSAEVEVRYRGFLPSGLVFDQTTGEQTRTFDLDGLIEGWSEALPLLRPGGSGMFFFPASLAYGAQSSGPIPPNSVIIFEIELVRVVRD